MNAIMNIYCILLLPGIVYALWALAFSPNAGLTPNRPQSHPDQQPEPPRYKPSKIRMHR